MSMSDDLGGVVTDPSGQGIEVNADHALARLRLVCERVSALPAQAVAVAAAGDASPAAHGSFKSVALSPSHGVSVGVGWNGGGTLPNAHKEALLFGATCAQPCTYVSGDTLTPPIGKDEFRGGATEAGPFPSEAVDLLLLVGHGGGAGTGFLLPTSGLNSSSVYFSGQLRWVVLDSCLTFHASRYEDPMTWSRVFGGIHMLLGFETLANDCAARGSAFAERLNQGKPVLQAWQEAVEETAPEMRWGVMSPVDDGDLLSTERIDSALGALSDYTEFELVSGGG